MPRRVQKAPRKRTGCATCKNAHVKCTEEKPVCRRCQRLSLPCQYEFKLLWEEDALQRNIVHGRAGVWTRDGRKSNPVPGSSRFAEEKEELVWITHYPKEEWTFMNFSSTDFEDGLPQELQDEDLIEEVVKLNMDGAYEGLIGLGETNIRGGNAEVNEAVLDGIVVENVPERVHEDLIPFLNGHDFLPPSTWPFDTDPQLFLPSYLPLVTFSEVDTHLMDYYVHELSPKCSLSLHHNPYLNILLPVAYEFEPLRHTLLAASACQLYHFSGDHQFELHSLRYRSKAIRGLNRHLNKEHMDWKSLATMVMFCFRDITDGCEPSWITHLKMGLRMLNNLLCTTDTDIGLRRFCEMYFVAHDVMGRTAWKEDVTGIEHYEWDRDENYYQIDSIMGCSRELISLISQISRLAGMAGQQGASIGNTTIAAAQLMNQLSGLHQKLQVGVEHAETMLRIAEVKRLSAMLYLHDRVMAPHANNSPALAHTLRDAIIDVIKQLPASSGASLWPLFILGKSNLSNHDQAQFVLDRLHQLEKSRYLGSFYHARRRVERNILKRLTAHGDVLQQTWDDDSALNDNERWVSLA